MNNITNENKQIIPKKSLVSFLLFSILVLPVFIELLNGFIQSYLNMSFSVGILYRLFIICAVLPFVFSLKSFYLKYYTLFIILLWLICNLAWIYSYTFDNKIYYSFNYESQYFLRILLVFLLLGFLLKINEKYEVNINLLLDRCILWSTIASSAIIISWLTGVGLKAYDYSDFGTKSFFIAINDISLTILIIFPFTLYNLIQKPNFKNLIITLSNILGLILISSRSGSLGCIGVIFIYSFALLFSTSLSNRKKIIFFSMSLIIFSIIVGSFIYILSNNPYLLWKIELLLKESPRGRLEVAGIDRINTRPEIFQIFGEGFYPFGKHIQHIFFNHVKEEDMPMSGQFVENDLFDIIGAYGYILGIFLALFHLFFIVNISLKFIKNKNMLSFSFLISLLLLMVHSIVAGHVLLNVYLHGILSVNYFYIIKTTHYDKLNKE